MRSRTFKALGLTSNTRKRFLLSGAILASASMACTAGAYTIPQFSTGSDISYYPAIEANGGTYSYNGQQTGILGAMTDAGVNTARIRLFTGTSSSPDTLNNLAYDLPMLQQVDAAGLYSVLNMHLSDTWASNGSGNQTPPSGWGSYNLSQMETALYNYCDTTMTTLRTNNAMPAMVTVGNEINDGILAPIGQLSNPATTAQWSAFAGLLNSAISGIDAGSNGNAPAIMLTVAGGTGQGGQSVTGYFQMLSSLNVKYNAIGYDYYPNWSGSLSRMQNDLNSLSTLGKPIILSETSYPYTLNSTNSSDATSPTFTYPITPAGQAQYAAKLISIVKAVPNGMGRGVWWWGGEDIPVANPNYFLNSWFYPYGSLFDQNGNALPVLNTLGNAALGSVPEPGSLDLLGAATVLAMVGGFARRRKTG